MRYKKLQDWLNWQETLNPKEIDLGLDRVNAVLEKLSFSASFFCPVITVAGTNGKGSTVAFIESILHQSGIVVGTYTSPHLFKYNERIRINQQPVPDDELCEAFDVIDKVRGDIALTYFEFGTLASFVIFKKYNVDVAVLEVGLGGRLDAVNVIDADVSVISSIGIDHIDWLGDDIEVIAREKAGIMRPHNPAVVSIFNPPDSLMEYAKENNVKLIRPGMDYLYQGLSKANWQLKAADFQLSDLPVPALCGGFQLQNASAAIMAISLLDIEQKPEQLNIAKGLTEVRLAGRYQQIVDSPQVVVDVAHNEQSAQVLNDVLNDMPVTGKTIAVVAMLADKAVAEVLQAVLPEVDQWISAGLQVARGMSSKNMAQAVRDVQSDVKLSVCENVTDACVKARTLAAENDRIIVFGSFYTVSEATEYFKSLQ
ncbi:MAG: bifunctional tetrahydrofolate synthase/dihydrofolate synthase [endosymbiont of Galathealinum brachiosum]|uniref:Dihydrofolate synthase/folylpolyglutamate synthase n=1 Tax=endosymbiont of Galathealinum brachiosum TaxID=2200906 RepID=A0A370DKC6_9GAMM|nr:MAG: bifunctional tetrahydrofolate synthase/dihydrofolate synthase [endosymbiont of Galathealinum brachiosum]